eukprot:TRINITY_DN2307_c0_g1_i1.p1 TRINITY_DN2307_c0_g1~~TRINITY_DN2307_c0_g1_i1.p1  ORF type:complete len:283 (+),score=94.85 TRINITY_DN2307_c0_g1_i1:195-1043(+)
MQVFVCVNGWLWREREIKHNWDTVKHLCPNAEVYTLKWETEELLALGRWIVTFFTTELAMKTAETVIESVSAVAGGFLAALATPMLVNQITEFVDNPWTVVAAKAKKAGKLLAYTLLDKPHGNRPVTLIGWSLGARVIFSCLEELYKIAEEKGILKNPKNDNTIFGIIENVYIIGGGCTAKYDRWRKVRPLIAGRFVNAYSRVDFLLPIIHKAATTKVKPVAGVEKIDVVGVENYDITALNGGHLNYRRNLKKILKYLNIHSSVESCNTKGIDSLTLVNAIL